MLLNGTCNELLQWQELFKAICKSLNSRLKLVLWKMMSLAVIVPFPILP